MDEIWKWICANAPWLFSGLGIFLVGGIAKYIRGKKKLEDSSNLQQTQNVTVNVGNVTVPSMNSTTNFEKKDKRYSSESIKAKTHILFIDDEDFPIVKRLRNAGWVNTKLKKNIKGVDDSSIIDAQIIFVDIIGVCKDLFNDEGLGLAKALKETYGNSKKVILYSAETEGNRFDKTLRMVDETLPKNAEVYQFINLVDRFANEIWKEN